MSADARVFLDACVLANFAVTDLLLRLAESPRQFSPAWSEAVLAEVYGVHTGRLGWPTGVAASFSRELRAHFPEALTSGYEHLVPAATNDPKDHHVLAAAAHAGAPVILTFNLRDFPPVALEPWGIVALHPQDYLLALYSADAAQVLDRIAAIAARRGETQRAVLERLGVALPSFARQVLGDHTAG